VERDRALRLLVAVEGDEGADVEVGQHVAVDHQERLVDAGEVRSKAHRAGRIEGLGLDGVDEADTRRAARRVGLGEGVGQ